MIENTDRKNVYDGNGLNDLWPFTFEISTDDGSDIAVYLTDDTGKTSSRLTSGYSVDVINKRVKYPAPAGTILPVGWKITLARETSLTQITSLTTQNFDPKSVEVALDKLTMAMQEAREIIDRALVADITVPAGTKYSLPAPNPGKAWGWNEEGTGVANYDNPAVAAAAAKLSADEAATSAAQSGYYATQAANSALQAGTVVDYEGEEPPAVTKPLLKWHKPSVHTIYLRNLVNDGWIEFMDSETGTIKAASGDTRFQLSGSLGVGDDNFIIARESADSFQTISRFIPTGKSLVLKRVCYYLNNANCYLCVAPFGWMPNGGSQVEETPNEAYVGTGQLVNIQIVIVNPTYTEQAVNRFCGWWVDLAIE